MSETGGAPRLVRKRKGDVYTADCPSRGVLDHVTSRWSSLILVMLLERTHRFSELAHRIGGVSERMLAHSLHALEGDGFVLRVVYPTKPPKVEYSLTPLGRELAKRVQALTAWVEENVSRVMEYRDRSARLPIDIRVPRTANRERPTSSLKPDVLKRRVN